MPQLCPFGTYSGGGATTASCTICTAGYQCIYGSTTAAPANSDCPKGFYCESVAIGAVNVILPKPCPVGTENPSLTKTAVGDCVACVGGFECEVGTAFKEISVCPPGWFCAGGVATACGPYTFNSYFGKTVVGDCKACSAGYYSADGSAYCRKCPPGSYCTGTALTACVGGTYNPIMTATSAADCLSCPKGYMCPGSGNAFPTPCPPGKFKASTGQTTCDNTAAGYASPLMATVEANFIPCTRGYHYPINSAYPEDPTNACVAGKINNNSGSIDSTDCVNCPAGYYCPSIGTAYSRIPPTACTQGHFCAAGSSAPTACSGGTYTNNRCTPSRPTI